jgi:hypothetical protein
MADHLAEDMRALADLAQVRQLDLVAMREQLARARRRRRAVAVLSLAVAAGFSVPLTRAVGGLQPPDRLASGPADDSSYVRVVSRQELDGTGGLPAEARACLTADATEVSASPRTVLRLEGSQPERARMVNCLRAVDGVQVLPQPGPQPRPVLDHTSRARLSPDQASRPGVDATAECSPPEARRSAPPFEGEAPIASAELIAGYLTDQHGHAEWNYEYNGSISFGNEPLTDELVRLCWYAGSGEYQLVASTVNGGLLPSSNARGPRPFPVLAPAPPRAMPAEEVERRAVVFPQPPGLELQE